VAGKGGKTITPAMLDAGLAKQPPAPLYVITGGDKGAPPDAIAVGRAVAAIRAATLGEGGDAEAWNLTLMTADRVTVAEILDAAATFPLGGGRRLIIVKGAEEIAGAKDEPGQKDQVAALARLGEDDRSPSVVVLVTPSLDGRLTVHKALLAAATVVACARPYPDAMPRWIAAEAKSRGVNLDASAAALLAGITGSDTLRAGAEIEKLRLLTLPPEGSKQAPRAVSPSDIAALAAGGTIADNWAVADAVAGLDLPLALALAHRRIEEGEEAPALIGALAFRVRQMILAAEALAAGLPPQALGKVAGFWGGAAETIQGSVRRYDVEQLPQALEDLLHADRAVKKGADPAHAVQGAILAIVKRATRTAPPPRGAKPARYTHA